MEALAVPPQIASQTRTRSSAPASQTPSGEDLAVLLSSRWFQALSESLRTAIVSRMQVMRVPAGTPIARRGQLDASWVGVIRGAVRLSAALDDGRAFTIEFLSPGQWFGDIALADQGEADVDVVTHVASTLVVVNHRDMRHLLEVSAEFRDALLQLNCQRLRRIYRRFEERHALCLPQRLAHQVQRLARQFGRPMDTGMRIDLMVSQSDLASMVGGSRQRVNRALRQMQQMGILQLGTQRLLVLDAEKLDAVASGRTVLPGSSGCSED